MAKHGDNAPQKPQQHEVLSQGEIDQLLTAISRGDLGGDPAATEAPRPSGDGRRIQIYDFKRPPVLTKHHIHVLHGAANAFAAAVTQRLSSRLGTHAQLHVASLDQLTYQEFVRSVPNPTVFLRVVDEHSGAYATLEIDPAITFALLARLLGGVPGGTRVVRRVTRTEQGVLQWLGTDVVQLLTDSVGRAIGARFVLDELISDPNAVGIAHASEMSALVTMEAMIETAEGMMNLCLPHAVLRPLVRSSPYQSTPERTPGAASRVRLDAGRLELPLDASLVMDLPTVSVKELARLRPGDRIACSAPGEATLVLTAGGGEVAHAELDAEQSGGAVVSQIAAAKTPIIRDSAADTYQIVAAVERSINALERRLVDRIARLERPASGSSGADPESAATTFRRLAASAPEGFAEALLTETPQTIAAVFTFLEPQSAARILGGMAPDQQADVVARAATLGRIDRAVLRLVADGLAQTLSESRAEFQVSSGGTAWAVQLLKASDRATEQQVITRLEEADPELAELVKEQLFSFSDIVHISDRHFQRVLREADTRDLAFAIRGADPAVVEKVYANMSTRAGELLREDVEYMGPVRMSDVREAQRKIIRIIRKLEEHGEIIVGDDNLIR